MIREDGLTKKEGKVMDSLVSAWNDFVKLGYQHPSDEKDFANAMHQCQHTLMMRILRRDYPKSYPIYKKKNREKDS